MGKTNHQKTPLEKDQLWYKTGIIYELHVRSFFDSNGDGIGDFRGLTQKLDYLQDLGVTALWLLPFYPSPLKDDGYDIADYFSIHPYYGNLQDFKAFLKEAHARGLRVITELVLNHTSDQHPWFQRSRRSPAGSVWRDFYVWNDHPDKYKEVRIIFKDFEASNWTWDPIARAYYWHRFYSHQPDLNFDNPQVHKEILRVFNFWLELGVDGFRLDAIPYLYEREGTSCESLPETHEFLKSLRRHVDKNYEDRMLLAEANQWPENAVAYFGSGAGDECHMAFHFPLMPRLFLAARMEDRVPIVDIMEQTPALPESGQWALFLRNHDELTLEMVTDEERDYMYRFYATDIKSRINLGIRRRLAPLLGNDRKKIELLNLLLLSLPGTPVVYYGDEIGMGENIFLGDRNGVRTPMHWSSDKNAGFSRCNPQGLFLPIILDPEYHYEANNVEVQQRNPHSLLWWMKRVLGLRKRWRAFGMGTLEFLHPENRKILAYIRQFENESILVVANLSRFPQAAELDLARFQNHVPVELFGRSDFPLITDKPYLITLHPHAAFWFSLEPKELRESQRWGVLPACPATLTVNDQWQTVLTGPARDKLEGCLPGFLKSCTWFMGRNHTMKSATFRKMVPVHLEKELFFITLVGVEYVNADPEEYFLPIGFAAGPAGEAIRVENPHGVISKIQVQKDQSEGFLYDAVGNPKLAARLWEVVAQRQPMKSKHLSVVPGHSASWRSSLGDLPATEVTSLSRMDQSNTLLVFGKTEVLKIFRRIESGEHPEWELGQALTRKQFTHIPRYFGSLNISFAPNTSATLGVLQEYIPNAKTGWEHTLDVLGRYFDRLRARLEELSPHLSPEESLLKLSKQEPSDETKELLGTYLEFARLLGQRTGEMHRLLGTAEGADFAPEPLTPYQQRSVYQSMRNRVLDNLHLLRKQLRQLPEAVQPAAEQVIAMESDILRFLKSFSDTRLSGSLIRCHGNYHLEQVLYTGKDVYIIDMEGDPHRPLGERRIKRSPFRDVGSMIRSFHYAAQAALYRQVESGMIPLDQLHRYDSWCRYWHSWVGAEFIKHYLPVVVSPGLVSSGDSEQEILLSSHLIEKALEEVGNELRGRPDWLHIPLKAIVSVMEGRKLA